MTTVHTEPINVAPAEQVREVLFDDAMTKKVAALLKRYPTKQAAVLPVLWLAQERWGWISPGVARAVASILELSPAYVEGVLTFYTMYRTEPPGKYVLQVCSTLSCELCGARALIEHLKQKLGISFGETTADRRFSLVDVQCLGACGEAPVVQINDDYYVNLTVETLDQLLDQLS